MVAVGKGHLEVQKVAIKMAEVNVYMMMGGVQVPLMVMVMDGVMLMGDTLEGMIASIAIAHLAAEYLGFHMAGNLNVEGFLTALVIAKLFLIKVGIGRDQQMIECMVVIFRLNQVLQKKIL